MSTGKVVFSLDFELGWGHRKTRPSYVDKLRAERGLVRERITELIDLFDRYEVPATWAVVGKLVESGEDSLFHAPDLFETLLDSEPDHDIGLHSYAHEFYDGLSESTADEDLDAGIDALTEWGCRPRSFVFPQNRISHLERLAEHDITCYREDRNPNRGFLSRFVSPVTFESSTGGTVPTGVPSSMFLAANRPSWYRRRYAFRGLTTAVKKRELVHYWLHPHNAVTDDSLLNEVEALLARVRSAADDGNVVLETMSGITATNRPQASEEETHER